MEQDKELFQLCKDVDARFPHWAEQDKYFCQFQNDSSPEEQRHVVHLTIETREEAAELAERTFIYQLETTPLYNSDYLLDKLPRRLGENPFEGIRVLSIDKTNWGASLLVGKETAWGISHTPLKALLKLTIALSDAGELK